MSNRDNEKKRSASFSVITEVSDNLKAAPKRKAKIVEVSLEENKQEDEEEIEIQDMEEDA